MAKARKTNQYNSRSPDTQSDDEKYYINGKTITILGVIVSLISGAILFVLTNQFNTKERELAVDYREKIENERDQYRKSINACSEEADKLRYELREHKFIRKQDSIKNRSHD